MNPNTDNVKVEQIVNTLNTKVVTIKHPCIPNSTIEVRADYGRFNSESWTVIVTSASIKLDAHQAPLWGYMWSIAGMYATQLRETPHKALTQVTDESSLAR